MGETTEIKNREQLLGLLREAIPELMRADPQLVLSAISGDGEATRKALANAGIIVSGPVAPVARDVAETYRSAKEEGRVITGFGARMRSELPARSYTDPITGRTRNTYLHGETMELAEAWVRAAMDKTYVDTKTGKNIREIVDLMNQKSRGSRAPTYPFTAEQGTGGGFLVPVAVAAEIFEEMNERFVLRNFVEVFTSAVPLRIPRRINQIAVSRGGASSNITQVDIPSTLGSVTLSPERVSCMAYVDPLLALAAAVGPVRWVIGQFAEAMAKDVQRVIIAGDQSIREPRGINNLPTSGQSAYDMAKTATWTDTTNATRRASMRELFYSIAQQHRESGKFVWVMNNDALRVLAGLNDTDQQPFRDQTLGAPAATFLGKQIVETLALTTASNETSIIGGDFSQYAWLESPEGMRIEQTTVGGEAWVSDSIGIKLVQSVDGAPVTPPTFGILTGVAV